MQRPDQRAVAPRPRIEHQTPEEQPIEQHAPVHEPIERRAQHRVEVDGGREPEIDQADEKDRRHRPVL